MKYFLLIAFSLLIACKPAKKELTAQQIIDKAMLVHGANLVSNAKIAFNFRDKSYEATRKKGFFELKRTFDSITDVLNNQGFQRFVHGKAIAVSDTLSKNYANAVNSVHYFAALPFGLNDKAVRKKLLPAVTIKGKDYYKVKITFSENGGGEDFEDVFIYWFEKEEFTMDYLAYTFHINGGGKRFRVAKNQQWINGIRFVAFDNYSPKNNKIPLDEIDQAFENNALQLVSEIVLQNIQVSLLKK